MAIQPQTIDINLGIDFGTSYTKVCYRDLNREETGIVSFVHVGPDTHLVPSVVQVGKSANLAMGWAPQLSDHLVDIPFLKMRLANSGKFEELPCIDGIELGSPKVIRALCAWFLALVLAHVRGAVASQEVQRLRGRKVRWSANVGVPVEQFDSEHLGTFEEVLKVGWTWQARKCIPNNVRELLVCYEDALTAPLVSDCHAYPEIVAAVHSFAMSRSAEPGMYLYFDIGGGTVDGVAFNFRHLDGLPTIECYSGKVSNLGVAALSHRIEPTNPKRISDALLRRSLSSTDVEEFSVVAPDLHKLVGYVVRRAKQKDKRSWIRRPGESIDSERRSNFQASTGRHSPLPVFVGGGASRSAWYRSVIADTHRVHKHLNSGIPPYVLLQLPMPKDRIAYAWPDVAFEQFAIAYGLAVPAGEGPDFSLPGAHDYVPTSNPFRPLGVTPYWETA